MIHNVCDNNNTLITGWAKVTYRKPCTPPSLVNIVCKSLHLELPSIEDEEYYTALSSSPVWSVLLQHIEKIDVSCVDFEGKSHIVVAKFRKDTLKSRVKMATITLPNSRRIKAFTECFGSALKNKSFINNDKRTLYNKIKKQMNSKGIKDEKVAVCALIGVLGAFEHSSVRCKGRSRFLFFDEMWDKLNNQSLLDIVTNISWLNQELYVGLKSTLMHYLGKTHANFIEFRKYINKKLWHLFVYNLDNLQSLLQYTSKDLATQSNDLYHKVMHLPFNRYVEKNLRRLIKSMRTSGEKLRISIGILNGLQLLEFSIRK